MAVHLVGETGELGWVALKTLLLFVTAVIGFRLGERRSLAKMSVFDFVAAVAAGAIIGRVPTARATSYLAGATTLVTILVTHAVIARLRYFPAICKITDHRPRVLVSRGCVLMKELKHSGLTRNDLYGLLRQSGITDLNELRLVIFEQTGQISIVRSGDPSGRPIGGLVEEVLRQGAYSDRTRAEPS